MVDITVYRGDGDKCMDTIVDALLTTEAAALYRGTQEMDENAQEYMTVDMTTLHRDGIEMANCLRIAEHVQAPYLYSKITDISYSVDNQNVTVKINTRRPLQQ